MKTTGTRWKICRDEITTAIFTFLYQSILLQYLFTADAVNSAITEAEKNTHNQNRNDHVNCKKTANSKTLHPRTDGIQVVPLISRFKNTRLDIRLKKNNDQNIQ